MAHTTNLLAPQFSTLAARWRLLSESFDITMSPESISTLVPLFYSEGVDAAAVSAWLDRYGLAPAKSPEEIAHATQAMSFYSIMIWVIDRNPEMFDGVDLPSDQELAHYCFQFGNLLQDLERFVDIGRREEGGD